MNELEIQISSHNLLELITFSQRKFRQVVSKSALTCYVSVVNRKEEEIIMQKRRSDYSTPA